MRRFLRRLFVRPAPAPVLITDPHLMSPPPDVEKWEKRYFYEWCPLVLCPHMDRGWNTSRGHYHWFRKEAPVVPGQR